MGKKSRAASLNKTSTMRGQVRSMDVGLCVPPVAHLVFTLPPTPWARVGPPVGGSIHGCGLWGFFGFNPLFFLGFFGSPCFIAGYVPGAPTLRTAWL